MLLTIHNLPARTQYSDVKGLILSKCGLRELVLDHLQNEGSGMKVTVGVMSEEDAALLISNLNNQYFRGQQLYVEDKRQSKTVQNSYMAYGEQGKAAAQQPIKQYGAFDHTRQAYIPSVQQNPRPANRFALRPKSPRPNRPRQHESAWDEGGPHRPQSRQQTAFIRLGDGSSPQPQYREIVIWDDPSESYERPRESNEPRERTEWSQERREPLQDWPEKRVGKPQVYDANCRYLPPSRKMSEQSEWPQEGPERPQEEPEQRQEWLERPQDQPVRPQEWIEQPQDRAEQPRAWPERPQEWLERPRDRPERLLDYPVRPQHRAEPRRAWPERPQERLERSQDRAEQPQTLPERPQVWLERPRNRAERPLDYPERPLNYPERPLEWLERQRDRAKLPQSWPERPHGWPGQPQERRDDDVHGGSLPPPDGNTQEPCDSQYRISRSGYARPLPLNPAALPRAPRDARPRDAPPYKRRWEVANEERDRGNERRDVPLVKRPSRPLHREHCEEKPNKFAPHSLGKNGNIVDGRNPKKMLSLSGIKGTQKIMFSIAKNVNIMHLCAGPSLLKSELRRVVARRVIKLVGIEVVPADDILKRYRKVYPMSDDFIVKREVERNIAGMMKKQKKSNKKLIPPASTPPSQPQRDSEKLNKIKKEPKKHPPKRLGKIPSYPQGDKNIQNKQKQDQKEELTTLPSYELPAPLQKAMEKETAFIRAVIEKKFQGPKSALREALCGGNHKQCIEHCMKFVTHVISKRLTNRGTKAVRIYGRPKLPRRAELEQYLSRYDCLSLKKAVRAPSYSATFNTFQNVDKLCNMQHTVGGMEVSFKYLHLWPNTKFLQHEAVNMKRRKFVNSLIEKSKVDLLSKDWQNQEEEEKKARGVKEEQDGILHAEGKPASIADCKAELDVNDVKRDMQSLAVKESADETNDAPTNNTKDEDDWEVNGEDWDDGGEDKTDEDEDDEHDEVNEADGKFVDEFGEDDLDDEDLEDY